MTGRRGPTWGEVWVDEINLIRDQLVDRIFGLPHGFTAWQQRQVDLIVLILGEDVRDIAGLTIVSARPRRQPVRAPSVIDWWTGDRGVDLVAVSCLQWVPCSTATVLTTTIFHIDLDTVRVHRRVRRRRRPLTSGLSGIATLPAGFKPNFPTVAGRADGWRPSLAGFDSPIKTGLPDMSEVLSGALSKMAAQLPAGIPLDTTMLEFEDTDPMSNNLNLRINPTKVTAAMEQRIASQKQWLADQGYGV